MLATILCALFLISGHLSFSASSSRVARTYADIARSNASTDSASSGVTDSTTSSVHQCAPMHMMPAMTYQDQILNTAWQFSMYEDKNQQKKAITLYQQFLQECNDDLRHIDVRLQLAQLLINQQNPKGKSKNTAPKIHSVLRPIMQLDETSDIDPRWLACKQLYASGLMADQYSREQNETKALICLCNILGTALNNDIFMPDGNAFPWHTPRVIIDIAKLLRKPRHMQDMRTWLQESHLTTEEQDKFFENLLEYAHYYGSQDGRLLLAHHVLKKHKYTKAMLLFQQLQRDGNTKVDIQTITSQWLSGDNCNEEMLSACTDQTTKNEICKLIQSCGTEEDQKKWWKLIFDNTSDETKYHAAYQLIALEKNAMRANIYRNLAASHPDVLTPEQLFALHNQIEDTAKSEALLIEAAKKGHQTACQEIFEKALKTSIKTDQDTYVKLLHAASEGGHSQAQLVFGIYWKNKIEESLIKKNQNAANCARQHATLWLKRASTVHAVAHLEIATIAEDYSDAIKQLLPFAKNERFSLCTEAQINLAKQYKAYAQELEQSGCQNKRRTQLIQRQHDHMLYWYEQAAKSGNNDVMLTYAAELLVYNQGNKKKNQQKHTKGIALCHTISEKNPKDIQPLVLLSKYYTNERQYQQAREQLIAAYKFDQKNIILDQTIAHYIKVTTLTGQFDAAKQLLQILLTISNDNCKHHIDLGYLYTRENNIASALEHYNHAGELGDASGFFNVAQIFKIGQLGEQNLEEALKYAHKALELHPKHIKSLNLVGDIYEHMNNHAEAFKYYKRSGDAQSAYGYKKMAEYYMQGFERTPNTHMACSYFNSAALFFNKQGDQHQALECQAFADVARLQSTNILDQSKQEDLEEKHTRLQKAIQTIRKKYDQAFTKLYAQTTDVTQKKHIIHIKKQFAAQCQGAFAIQCFTIGNRIPDKKTAYYHQAIEHLSTEQDLTNIRNTSTLTQIILNLVPRVSYEQLDTDEQKLIDQAEQHCASIIALESSQPNNYFIPVAYNTMGIIQHSIHQDIELAKKYFLAGGARESVPCFLGLAELACNYERNPDKTVQYAFQARLLSKQQKISDHDTDIIKILKDFAGLRQPLAQVHYGIILEEKGLHEEAQQMFSAAKEHSAPETLKLLSATYAALGNDLKAHETSRQLALTGDPYGLSQFASEYHIGYANEYDIKKASELYKQAAEIYAAQEHTKEAEECQLLATITAHQIPDCFKSEMTIDETVKSFEIKLSELKTIIEEHKDNESSRIIAHQARLALASLYYNMGNSYDDSTKKNSCIMQSLEHLKKLPPTMTAGLYNHAIILYEYYLQPLLPELTATPYTLMDPTIQKIASTARNLFENILKLECKQPNNYFLLRSYAPLSQILALIFDDLPATKSVLKRGAQKQHAQSMILLATLQLGESNDSEGLKKAMRTANDAIKAARKINNATLVKRAEETLAHIVVQTTKHIKEDLASPACSSSSAGTTDSDQHIAPTDYLQYRGPKIDQKYPKAPVPTSDASSSSACSSSAKDQSKKQ